MGRHLLAATSKVLTAALVTVLAIVAVGATSARQPADEQALELSGEVSPGVRELVAVVVSAMHAHDVDLATTELEFRFVDRVEGEGLVAGETDGRLVVVGRNVAMIDRTLLHEIAHALVGVEFDVEVDHGEPWRSVYVTAVREVLGDRMAERELRRIEWVYDKSYLDAAE